mmetsp:Transcript_48327/g.100967  ORF Transcript_48327/g.100967 Transcript_48327/m.100967 type:complete len:175 (-) Transcript_48327:211-735(-)
MQSRRRVLTNKSMAELFGLHSEEALARFAVHDFALPVSEADGMRHFIYDLMSTQRDMQHFYYRMTSADGRGCLVRRTSLRLFDSAGRLVTVKNTTQAVSPNEYDEAVRRNPMVSTLAATGDLRTGRQLLADAAKDHLVTIASMAASKDGRAELDAMAKATEALAHMVLNRRDMC